MAKVKGPSEEEMMVRQLRERAEIAVAMLSKLADEIERTSCRAEPDDESWPEVRAEIERIWYAAGTAVLDLLDSYEPLAMAIED